MTYCALKSSVNCEVLYKYFSLIPVIRCNIMLNIIYFMIGTSFSHSSRANIDFSNLFGEEVVHYKPVAFYIELFSFPSYVDFSANMLLKNMQLEFLFSCLCI